MKKIALTLSLIVAATGATMAADQRVDSARFAVEQNREYRGDREFRDDRDWGRFEGQTGYAIERLNRDVRHLRYELRTAGAPPRIWSRFGNLARNTEQLTAAYQQHRIRGWDARRRADALRDEADRIRAIFRNRHIGGLGWR